ncbi:MAG: DUF2442 domain-containing protein [Caldilineaceae bacterium]|nr:DUF2442 domain-containing protein [Caldilineaceae bacterium]MBP8110183.1 DUF2442 domain-containing protein [Caldilineaceae bacterium]MBP8125174.1 DUF2442 domain-containing protein [Caldilineaceae bacterium]MBP9074932.1 DUF2442 domain-containing protein [Caldilineaceae bacterium]
MTLQLKTLEEVKEKIPVQKYPVRYPLSAYTFPEETLIHEVRLDEKFLHVDLTDGRTLSIPIWWIPTLHHADPTERAKFEINRNRTMIVWNPDTCAINEEVRISDYLGTRMTVSIQA